MNIQLSDHFTMGRLLRFTLPSIVMMVCTSIYSVVDGLFVANIVGSDALASINIVMPLFLVLGAFGFMLGTGGSAEVAKTMGEGRDEDAKSYFTNLTLAVAVLGVALTLGTVFFIRPISYLLGASDRRGVWHHLPDRQYALHAAGLFPGVFHHGGKAAPGHAADHCQRSDQYGAGLAVYRGAGMGHCRRRCGDVHRLRRGRLFAADLFCT